MESDLARARAIIAAHGWNTTSYQLLNPGFIHWYSSQHDALVGYVRAGKTRVVGGAPVCTAAALSAVAQEFEQDASSAGDNVCYFAAEERLEALYRNSPQHAKLRLGAQPAWDPHEWPACVASHPSLRAQFHRARNKGVTVRHWPSIHAHGHTALRQCLEQWLARRGLPPLHFLVEPETLTTLDDRAVFVAERGGVPVGFLVASPVAKRNGWLVEQFVRGDHAPNGTVDLLLDTAVRWMTDHGATYVTLGLAPLSERAGAITSSDDPWWLRALFAWIRAHGRRFYNFDGLDAFKAKYRPTQWEPVYAIVSGPAISLNALYAIASAFTDGRPFSVIARGLGRALLTEAKRVRAWESRT